MTTTTLPTRIDRFNSKIDRSGGPDGCWPWTGYVDPDTGYGQFWDGTRLVKAHRFAFGDVPPGLVVDHHCHNMSGCRDVPCAHRRCCNPAHLRAVTQSKNSIDGRSGDHHSAKDRCSRGHLYTPENTITRSRNGRERRSCRECNRGIQKTYNAKRKQVA